MFLARFLIAYAILTAIGWAWLYWLILHASPDPNDREA
jgi:hypothetical protein